MTKQEIKNFIKKHKKEILIGAGVTLVGGVVYLVTKNKPKFNTLADIGIDNDFVENFNSIRLKEQARIEAFNCGVGTVTDMWDEGGALNLIINDITIDELGLLGKEFIKLDEVSDNTTVNLVVGLINDN